MTETSEYGDVITNAYIDEWGRRRANSLLEDGVKILAFVGAPIIRAWFNSLMATHNLRRPHRAIKMAQALQTLHTWFVSVPAVIIRQWSATLKLSHILRRPERKMLYTQALKPAHTLRKPLRVIRIPALLSLIHTHRRPHRLIRLLQLPGLIHVCYISKPGVKKTRLFLVIGELALQLSGD
ncbi:MAG: hypothetical protein QXK47_03800 [Candidatus Bathyarchaeia archaeon]